MQTPLTEFNKFLYNNCQYIKELTLRPSGYTTHYGKPIAVEIYMISILPKRCDGFMPVWDRHNEVDIEVQSTIMSGENHVYYMVWF